MIMAPRLRKFALTAHVTTSVGWLGATAGFLALAVAGLTSQDDQLSRGVYLAMDVLTWAVIVPLNLASLLTGLVQALGTPWGLFRHYWVLAKLVLNVLATVVLLLHTQLIGYMADLAATGTMSGAVVDRVRSELVVAAGAAVVVVLTATVLGVFKPRGMTWLGKRKQREHRQRAVLTH